MPNPSNAQQQADREYRAWVLRTQKGWSEHRIAAELGITQPGVNKILNRIQLRITNQLGDLIARVKLEQHYRLEVIYSEAMEAWEGSKAPKKREIRKAHRVQPPPPTPGQQAPPPTPGQQAPPPQPYIMEQLETEETQRDPGYPYLQAAIEALESQRKLWNMGEYSPAGDRDQPIQGTAATPPLPPLTRVILNIPAKTDDSG